MDNMLTKQEKINLYAEKFEVTKAQAKEELDKIEQFYAELLTEYQEGFAFGNIGKFEIYTKPERAYRNPSTGEMGDPVPAHTAVKFKLSGGKTSVKEVLKNQ